MRTVAIHDIEALERALRQGDVAALILEPEGAFAGTVPMDPDYLRSARELTARHGALLIFDEVVSGFRMSPGGAQAFFGVTPDLTTLGKIVSGGLPGGAVCGQGRVMATMAFSGDQARDRRDRVWHTGTWNGNPLSASAGIAALRLLSDGAPQERAATLAERLRSGIGRAIRDAGWGGGAYGRRSSVRFIVGDRREVDRVGATDDVLERIPVARLIEGTRQPLHWTLRRALMLEGVDMMLGNHGWTSVAHTEDEIDATVERFARALDRATSAAMPAPTLEATGAPGRSGGRG
jgi:glutamate-1-semialdehyde 2,1-aminomutase